MALRISRIIITHELKKNSSVHFIRDIFFSSKEKNFDILKKLIRISIEK